MQVEQDVQKLIDKINSGELKKHLTSLEGTDFGLYIPIYAEGNVVKPMLEGYTQVENNQVISLSKIKDGITIDALPIAWYGNPKGLNVGKDSKCNHPRTGPNSCKHCTGHTDRCRHCTGHKDNFRNFDNELKAPKLDYDNVIKELDDKQDLLNELANENFGITLLHGHNDEHMFTKLPTGYVSVIIDNVTYFKKEEEVIHSKHFVPNMWKSVNGELKIAGGYLSLEDEN